MKYPKIGICDFTITNSTMHYAHCSTKVIPPEVIVKFTKLKKTDEGRVNSDHNPVKSTFDIEIRNSTAKVIQGVQRIPNTDTGYLVQKGYKKPDEPENAKSSSKIS